MEQAPDAASTLDLHGVHVRAVNERSAQIAWVVEHAAEADPVVGDWATYRTLTGDGGPTPAGFERWLRRYYRAMLE